MPTEQSNKKLLYSFTKRSLFPAVVTVASVFVCSYICSLIYINFSSIVSFIDALFHVTPDNYTATMGFTVLLVLLLVIALYYLFFCEVNDNPPLNALFGVCIFSYIAMLIVITRSMPDSEMSTLQLALVITAYSPIIACVLLVICLLGRGK